MTSMKFHEEFLRKQAIYMQYTDDHDQPTNIRRMTQGLKDEGISEIYYTELLDD